jgi:hypothetical protein
MLLVNQVAVCSSPIILRQLLIFLSNENVPFWIGVVLSFSMFFAKLVEFQFYNIYFQPVQRINMKVCES